jgi:propanol-preferring alcohol dehydrogenase
MIVVGTGPDPMEVATAQLWFGTRAIEGSLTGLPIDSEDSLAFSVLQRIRARIETVPLEPECLAHG